MPPLLPTPSSPYRLPQFQTVSDVRAPFCEVVKVVAPTCVMKGLLDGSPSPLGSSTSPGRKASLSPDALKNVWPCAIICLKIWSVVAFGPPIHPHEQLTTSHTLS